MGYNLKGVVPQLFMGKSQFKFVSLHGVYLIPKYVFVPQIPTRSENADVIKEVGSSRHATCFQLVGDSKIR